MRITFEELQAFISVVDCGSITAAAEQLNMTISTVSRLLLRLEEKINTTLIYRTTRSIKLSDEGAAFLQKSRKIVELAQEAEDMLSIRQTVPSGKLRIDASTPFLTHVIAPLIPQFYALYPQIELEIHNYEGITNLLEKRIDVAFRIGVLKDSSLNATLLGFSRQRLVASPDYLEKYGVPESIEELKQHCLLGFTQPDSLNIWPIKTHDGNLFKVSPDISGTSGEVLFHLAVQGAGILCSADFVTLDAFARGELVQVLEKKTIKTRQPINAVYYRNQAVSPRLRCFIEFIKKYSTKIEPH
ncbi:MULTISPECIES: LysR family transcriptional regulator [Providencia]|uniref:D-malate degradation protein R n=1 Tax=Providencia rettgeri TaxID=587 RepID=A0A379FRY4_PRORE|nr:MULTISPECIES: LysR family transcriptional regulator [Providencia]EJF7710601.1 LysR family transcriptional regulator [Providencia rettgeri]MCX9107715.1 LysR family transcriptional regulator [Providencia rettgeri]MCX9115687.1 LysR family transcriptional regulator [Providencia rettgeri]MDH2364300.1 LysR family transcriptional regulator [Providencia rettgeri]QXB04273.1 LysR family transcriptional regulator [Providencia rettgeri]